VVQGTLNPDSPRISAQGGAFVEQSGRKRRQTQARTAAAKTAQTSQIRRLQLPIVARTMKW
jgi:hypothetical protein